MRMLVAVVMVGALAASVAIACHHSEYERDVLTEQFNEIAEQSTGQTMFEGELARGNQITSESVYENVVRHEYDYNGDGVVSHGVSSGSINGVSYTNYTGDYEITEHNRIDEMAAHDWSDPQDAVNQLAALKEYVNQRIDDFSNMSLAEWMDPSWAYDADGNIKDTSGGGSDGLQADGLITSDDTWSNSGYRNTLVGQLQTAVDNLDSLINTLMSKYGLTSANPSGWQMGDRDEWSGEAPGGTTEPSGPVPTVVPPTTTGTNTAQVAEDK